MAVREGCGIFDVSHMGEIETCGPRGARAAAAAALQRRLPDPVPGDGRAGLSTACSAARTAACSTISSPTASSAERYLTVTNASNHARDLAWFRAHADAFDEAEVTDRIDDYAMLAVQGPLAREIVQAISDAPLPARMTAATAPAGGRGGARVRHRLHRRGRRRAALPPRGRRRAVGRARRAAAPFRPGLAARDTLRLEACFHLYGNDLTVERGPIEAGLGWCCRRTPASSAREAVRAVRERGPSEKLVAFTIDGPGIARQGNPVLGGGEVTSGTLSPCLGVGIGMAYVPAERAAVGTPLEIDVRGKMRPAVVKQKPLYRKGS